MPGDGICSLLVDIVRRVNGCLACLTLDLALALVDHVCQLVCKQLTACRGTGVICSRPKKDVLPYSKGPSMKLTAELVRLSISVHADLAEIVAHRLTHFPMDRTL